VGKLQIESAVSLATGYNDNVTFNPFEPLGAGFVEGELKARFELQHSPRWSLDLDSAYLFRHFYDQDAIGDEVETFTTGNLRRVIDSHQSAGVELNYFYLQNYFDSSLSDIELSETELRLHEYGSRLYYAHFGPDAFREFGFAVSETDIEASSDDYRTYAIDGLWKTGDWLFLSSLSLVDYTDRSVRRGDGSPLGEETARVLQSYVYLSWSTRFGPQEQTELTLSPSYNWGKDLRGDYETNHRFNVRATLAHEFDRSTLSASIGGKHQSYDARTFFDGTEELDFWRSSWFWRIAFEQHFSDSIALEISYQEDRSDSSDLYERYTQRVIQVSTNFRF
jgi:hypothetical protein